MSAWEEAEDLADRRADQEDEHRDDEDPDEDLRPFSHERIRAMRAFPLLTIQTPIRALGG